MVQRLRLKSEKKCNLNNLILKKLTPKCSNEHVECSFDNRVKKFPTKRRKSFRFSLKQSEKSSLKNKFFEELLWTRRKHFWQP